jgi:peptidoglycan glycosyltransferase
MRKVENRAKICLLLAAALFIGLIVFTWRFVTEGADWASFYGNQQVYTNGVINRGTIYDRNGVKLLQCTKKGLIYPDDETLRRATVHVVGDPDGNVASGAINKWKSELIGYDLLNGTYDTTKDGKKITLTLDSDANVTAYNALAGREGTVGVFNYETGEIMCMVSTPSFDPEAESASQSSSSSSIYFNTFLDGTLTPGSTFKLVTAAAAIDNVSDIDSFTYTCTGSTIIGGSTITCPEVHGSLDFDSALAKSCNGAFGEIALKVGAKNMRKTTKQVGLTKSLDVSGIKTAKGSFSFPSDDDNTLAWAGIGQAKDQVNPCSMMVYVGSIANGGEAVQPYLISNSNFLKKLTGGKSLGSYLDESTADELKSMMKNNVKVTYGESNFYGLDIYAKSGTAEYGGSTPNAWFVGFIDDPDHPYAFVVWIKDGGTGYKSAGPVAYKTLETLVQND